jgi:hypothetical protein
MQQDRWCAAAGKTETQEDFPFSLELESSVGTAFDALGFG